MPSSENARLKSELASAKSELDSAKNEIERLKRELRSCRLKLGMSASHCDAIGNLLRAKLKDEERK